MDTQRRVFGAREADCRRCALRAAVTIRPPIFHAAMTTWRDVPGRRLRRTWSTHWQRQVVTIAELPLRLPPHPRPPHAARAHRRLGWDERFGRNPCAPLNLATIRVAGVCPALVERLSEWSAPARRQAAAHPLIPSSEEPPSPLPSQGRAVLSRSALQWGSGSPTSASSARPRAADGLEPALFIRLIFILPLLSCSALASPLPEMPVPERMPLLALAFYSAQEECPHDP